MSQHFADGLDRYSLLERDQRGERVPPHVVDKVLAESRHQTQGFHISSEGMVVLWWEKSLAGIVPVFLNQRDGFRKQLDTSEVVGFLSTVLQPEVQSASSTGSTNNDPFCMQQGQVMKTSNHSGGTLGGMSDGSQLILRAAIKPTPSISQMQHTVTNSGEEIELSIHGRHDPIIVPRAVVVVEAMTALTLADLLLRNAVSRMNQIKQLYTEDKNV